MVLLSVHWGLVFMIWFCCFRCLFVRCFDELLCLCVYYVCLFLVVLFV